jgi:hypothetical protein
VTDENLLAYLGDNANIDDEVIVALLDSKSLPLLINLAGNDALDEKYLVNLFDKGIFETYEYLAINKSTPSHILEKLYQNYGNEKAIQIALAYNTSTPVKMLTALYELDDFEITQGIASNASVPLEILNILKIDTRLRNELTANETFVTSITQKLGL